MGGGADDGPFCARAWVEGKKMQTLRILPRGEQVLKQRGLALRRAEAIILFSTIVTGTQTGKGCIST